MFTDIKRRVSRLGSSSSNSAIEKASQAEVEWERQTATTPPTVSSTTSHISFSDQSDYGSSAGTIRQSHASSSSTVSIPMPGTPSGRSSSSITSSRGSGGGRYQHPLGLVDSTNRLSSDICLDHSHLKPGSNAALLSYTKTIDMYRANCRRTQDPNVRCSFAIFLVEASKRIPGTQFLQEAEKILKQLALRGHTDAQYYLANFYVSGITDEHHEKQEHKPDFQKAFPLYVQAAKHCHPDAAYRAGKCYEEGLGTRRDVKKALNFYRKAATLNHPGAMYSLGLAELRGHLGTTRHVRDGYKWLKRSAEAATHEYPHALHELGMLHEKGFSNVIFSDPAYSVKLYGNATALGYAPSAFRLGKCYEFGHLGCAPNPSLSLYYYSIAAHQGHAEACFAMTTWYLVGIPGVASQSDEQAWTWAMRAAQRDLPIAYHALGYFCEVGIGHDKDGQEAIHWYQKAAKRGVKRAINRLAELGEMVPSIDTPSPTPTRPLSSLLVKRRKPPLKPHV